jgi:hypothetical protein
MIDRIAMMLRRKRACKEPVMLTNARELLDLAPRCGGGVLGIWWTTPREQVCRLAGRSFRMVAIVCVTETGAQQLATSLQRRRNVGVRCMTGQLRIFVDGQPVTGYAVLAPISPDRARAQGWWQAPPLAEQSGYLAEKERRARRAEQDEDSWSSQDKHNAFVGEAEPDYLFRELDRAQEWDAIYERRPIAIAELSEEAEDALRLVDEQVALKFTAETDFASPFAYLDWRKRRDEARKAGELLPPVIPPCPREPAKAVAYKAQRAARQQAKIEARQELHAQARPLAEIAAEVCGQTAPASDLLELARRRQAALWAGWDEKGDGDEALLAAGRRMRREAQARAVATGAALAAEDVAHALQEA